MKRITPCLWFDGNAEEAVNFYTSIFPDSKIKQVEHTPDEVAALNGMPAGSVMTVLFELNGQEFMALNGGPEFKFNQAISFMVVCEDQDEIDRYWEALSGSGGEEVQCGWLKDKFGVAWQIIPTKFWKLMNKSDAAGKSRIMMSLMPMKKLDIATIKQAAEG